MTPLQALIDARALIAEPERWTQESMAKAIDGRPVLERDAGAVCWCIAGAIYRAAGSGQVEQRALEQIRRAVGIRYVVEWNDAPERTHAEVLAAFDAAIARLEAQQ